MAEAVDTFLDELQASISAGTFIKMTLGNYKGPDKRLQKVLARPIETKKGLRLYVLYRYDTRDTAKNFDQREARGIVAGLIADGFASGHLFTSAADLQLEIGRKGKARLNRAKPTSKTLPRRTHDREKNRRIDQQAFYLQALGITGETGTVREKQQDKWRQINKYVEILDSLVARSRLKAAEGLRIVDMGSGKGYLTFAAYDYFNNARGIKTTVTGVETRPDLVAIGNEIADASGFDGLNFIEGTIGSYELGPVDILVALHACNTATDDALYKAIRAGAEIIVAVPCCHHELRPQIKPPDMLRDVLKHPVMLERVAETMTDGIRSLLLEREGYSTKLFEFVAVEHTPKNNMLVGTKLPGPHAPQRFDSEINEIKDYYGIRHQHLAELLDREGSGDPDASL